MREVSMKSKFLASMMFAAALSQVACDKSPQETASDCVSKGPACTQLVMQSQGPMLIPLGAATAGLTPGAPGQVPLTQQPFRTATIANAAIQAHSLKVAQAIAADDANPLSPYY